MTTYHTKYDRQKNMFDINIHITCQLSNFLTTGMKVTRSAASVNTDRDSKPCLNSSIMYQLSYLLE